MHDWDVINRYAEYHPRWFETPARHEPGCEYTDVFSALMPESWELRRSGMWYVATPPGSRLPDQGWKLHVAVRTDDSVAAFRTALGVLRDQRACFKFLLDPRLLASVNGKLWPRGSSGKFVTIYPRDHAHFGRVAERLAAELKDYRAPYILSDCRWPGSRCVFYRYGGFRSRSVLQPDGTRTFVIRSPNGADVPDVRAPYWDPPEWVEDPLGQESGRKSGSEITLGGGRFTVTAALRFSNRGGVYRGFDNSKRGEVAIKEARREVEVGRNRVDAITLLEKEWRLLNVLSDTGFFVRPVAFFHEGEHAFLAEEFVHGQHLGRLSIRRNPLYHGSVTVAALDEYLLEMRSLWVQVARAIAAAHDRRIILGDLSFTNLIVDANSKVQVLDLESAVEEEVDEYVGLHTPGVTAPEVFASTVSDRWGDYYALGAILFGSLVLANGVTGFFPPALPRFLDALRADVDLPDELVALITDLMTPRSRAPSSVTERIERLPLENRSTSTRRGPRLGLPATTRMPDHRRRDLRVRAVETIAAVARYVRATADVERHDRLVPADLMVFETNPLSVAFGAAGVLYALERLTGDVPRHLLDWFLERRVGSEDFPPGLYLGQAGIAWVVNELGHPDYAITIMRSARQHDLLWKSPDVMCGAAGYGLACLKFWSAGHGSEFLDDAQRVGAHLAGSAKKSERGVYWPDENGDVPLGYAYGGSGIALFLLYLHLATLDREPLVLGRDALRFELAHGVWWEGKFGGFPALATDAEDDSSMVARCYWDAGSAGVVTAVTRYVAATEDDELARWLPHLADDVKHKYAVMPQLFHGLAGLGNGLLDIWEQTGDEEHLAEAWEVAEGVMLFAIDRPEGRTFPGEQSLRESADFATGAAGVALFLDRLVKADAGGRGNFNFVVDELLATRAGATAGKGIASANV